LSPSPSRKKICYVCFTRIFSIFFVLAVSFIMCWRCFENCEPKFCLRFTQDQSMMPTLGRCLLCANPVLIEKVAACILNHSSFCMIKWPRPAIPSCTCLDFSFPSLSCTLYQLFSDFQSPTQPLRCNFYMWKENRTSYASEGTCKEVVQKVWNSEGNYVIIANRNRVGGGGGSGVDSYCKLNQDLGPSPVRDV
jgi:hypothetical protein